MGLLFVKTMKQKNTIESENLFMIMSGFGTQLKTAWHQFNVAKPIFISSVWVLQQHC